ncbi:LIRP-like [Camponotus floridanus]|uniref:LIRP-like n=1 Tax=Camponotus floridanus TaxID=104421 RepID=UPI000DC6BF4E|nr:LIRP-like [Camponotus floridanus]XP_025264379.1 LIRP-like [Camponotus floridanus]XP_025264381.1 LIRP-like [Camponotus floridanus]XP_025264382.1 LIRP-like [Camponotus floridanus]
MSTNQLNVLVSLMIAIAFIVSESKNAKTNPEFNQEPEDIPKKYCGKDLADTLRKLCRGVYNTPDMPYNRDQDDSSDKNPDMPYNRDQDDCSDNNPDNSLDLYLDLDFEKEIEKPDYPSYCELFLQASARELNEPFAGRRYRRETQKRKHQKKGIVEECCDNACNLTVLRTYCG